MVHKFSHQSNRYMLWYTEDIAFDFEYNIKLYYVLQINEAVKI